MFFRFLKGRNIYCFLDTNLVERVVVIKIQYLYHMLQVQTCASVMYLLEISLLILLTKLIYNI